MPRRPNTKNLPSRLFEETTTPIFMVGVDFCVSYANQALASLFGTSPDEIVGKSLKHETDENAEPTDSGFFSLCPPASLVLGENTATSSDSNLPLRGNESLTYTLQIPEGKFFLASCLRIAMEEQAPSSELVCSLSELDKDQVIEKSPHWLHEKIQLFRVSQSSRFSAIPYLGESYSARKCFAQARSFALVESNVSVVGHPQSQAVDVAKSIHYSGFTKLDEPEPLLPVNCRQVNGERIQEALVGHCQVNLSESDDSKAHVLLINADAMDPVAQRDLLTMVNLDQLQLRLIVTSAKRLQDTNGFDEELAHRLSTLELTIPDLAERRSDTPLLAHNILERQKTSANSISEELTHYLQIYPWGSDYQELESVIEKACAEAKGPVLTLADCPHDFRMALKALENPVPKIESIDLDQLLADIEKETIDRAVEHANGNKTLAAKILGITRARLHRKIADSANSTNGDTTQSDTTGSDATGSGTTGDEP